MSLLLLIKLPTYSRKGLEYRSDVENVKNVKKMIADRAEVSEGERIVAASTKFQLSYKPKYDYNPILIGSYNGFLLFRHFLNGAFLIFNPTTQEQVLLTGQYCEGCALYYHTPTNELKFLYKKLSGNHFFILGLKSKLRREISNRAGALCICHAAPVILYGRMHWMANVYCVCCIRDPPRLKSRHINTPQEESLASFLAAEVHLIKEELFQQRACLQPTTVNNKINTGACSKQNVGWSYGVLSNLGHSYQGWKSDCRERMVIEEKERAFR
ncbi:hypothetical protein IFM89_034818 [Coptis chinensis]|uniref:Uncharacterized protein n=1 Tax=Coptis chinensis TaxID=261450 RepID=A0A835LHE1_9MAGN|nr:hypothetical protein IFM89_034818 [Coptis chinensis]